MVADSISTVAKSLATVNAVIISSGAISHRSECAVNAAVVSEAISSNPEATRVQRPRLRGLEDAGWLGAFASTPA
jgi:hypothetical protein